MKLLLTTAVFLLIPNTNGIADEVFGNWTIFLGNPEATDFLPDADPENTFSIGQIIFEYPVDRPRQDRPVTKLSELQSVAAIVKAAIPGPALRALIEQQLKLPHDFEFESAKVVDFGDDGFMWKVEFYLVPFQGGIAGVPFRYQALLDGHGKLIPPRLTIYDAFFHSSKGGWTSSAMRLPEGPTAKKSILTDKEIRQRAITSLVDATKRKADDERVAVDMVYQSQQLVSIPVATDEGGNVTKVNIWAVNFRDPAVQQPSKRLFTVWVTEDGRTADIGHIDHWFPGNSEK